MENLISLNQIGIVVLDRSKPNLGSASPGADLNSGQNRIFDNMQYNLYNHSSELILAENNSWGSSDQSAIDGLNYDNKDDARFGSIDTSPILGARETSEALVVLSQNTVSQPAREASSGTPAQPVSSGQPAQIAPVSNRPKTDTEPVEVQKNITLQPELVIESRIEQVQPLLAESKTKENERTVAVPQEPEIDMEQIFLEPFLDSPKEILYKEMPQLSEAAFKFKESGRIIISVVVSKGGLVENTKLLKGLSPIYNEAALKAARNFRYRPGKVKNQAVRFSTTIVFQF
jgi:TonB family protein